MKRLKDLCNYQYSIKDRVSTNYWDSLPGIQKTPNNGYMLSDYVESEFSIRDCVYWNGFFTYKLSQLTFKPNYQLKQLLIDDNFIVPAYDVTEELEIVNLRKLKFIRNRERK